MTRLRTAPAPYGPPARLVCVEQSAATEVINSAARMLHQVEAELRGIANANVAPGPSFVTAHMRP